GPVFVAPDVGGSFYDDVDSDAYPELVNNELSGWIYVSANQTSHKDAGLYCQGNAVDLYGPSPYYDNNEYAPAPPLQPPQQYAAPTIKKITVNDIAGNLIRIDGDRAGANADLAQNAANDSYREDATGKFLHKFTVEELEQAPANAYNLADQAIYQLR